MDDELNLNSKFIISFMCPQCKHEAVVDDDREADSIKDVETGDFMVCTHCGAGYTAEVRAPFHNVMLLNIEEHELDNDVEGNPPEDTTAEEDAAAFEDEEGNISIADFEPSFEEDVALHTGINKPCNKDMSFEDYVESFGLGTADMSDEDYDMWEQQYNEYINSTTTIECTTEKMKYSTLVDKLTKVTKDDMINTEGFSEDEVVDYFTVDVSLTSDNDYYSVQVRAELDYDGMDRLASKLNKIVQSVDKDAYFDFDEPGIMTAYLPASSIEASTKTSKTQTIESSLLDYYGDPYDIYFTRDELNEFGYDMEDAANEALQHDDIDDTIRLVQIVFEDDYRTLTAELTDGDGNDYVISHKIDMRRVINLRQLRRKYMSKYLNELLSQYSDNHSY